MARRTRVGNWTGFRAFRRERERLTPGIADLVSVRLRAEQVRRGDRELFVETRGDHEGVAGLADGLGHVWLLIPDWAVCAIAVRKFGPLAARTDDSLQGEVTAKRSRVAGKFAIAAN